MNEKEVRGFSVDYGVSDKDQERVGGLVDRHGSLSRWGLHNSVSVPVIQVFQWQPDKRGSIRLVLVSEQLVPEASLAN